VGQAESSHPRNIVSPPALALAALALALTLLAVVLIANRNRPDLKGPGEGLRISLAVEPFEVDYSVGGRWDAPGFADSLASQLSVVPGILASTSGSGGRYVLRGSVAIKDGRLILATRLGRDGDRDTVWTATFWRSGSSGSSVLADIAAAVAEAVLSESVRETLTSKRDKP